MPLTDRRPTREYASAGGVVVDASGENILVLLRPNRLGSDGHPEVRLPKGHIEPGESRPEAALREAREETGLFDLEILADLGHQTVEFDWQGYHYVRDESCFLLTIGERAPAQIVHPEKQFEPLWLTWDEALARLTFAAEREWVRRAQAAYVEYRCSVSQNVPDQHPQ